MVEERQETAQPRVITPAGATAVVAGSMLGIGIFLTPPIVARAIDSPLAFLACWMFGALLAFAGATAYAELGAMFPEAGGDYVFLRRAYGPSVGIASGLVLFVGIFTGSLATMAVAVCQFQLESLLSTWFGTEGLMAARAPVLGASFAQLCGIGLVFLLTLLNVLGTRLSARLQIAVTAVPVLLLALGAIWVLATAPHASALDAAPTELDLRALAGALAAIYFAYAGWNAVAYVAGEVRDPGRTLPWGLLGGTGVIAALYALLCLGFVAALGIGGMRDAFEVGSASAAALGDARAEQAVTVLIAIALLGSLNTTVLAGARIAYALAERGSLPRYFAASHTRFDTPARALWLQAVLASILILSGGFEALLEMTSIAMLLLAGLTVMSVPIFRRRLPDHPRPYRTMGYPLLPVFFALSSLAIITVSVWNVIAPAEPAESGLERYLPVVGLALFVALWLGHRLVVRARGKKA